MSVITSQISDMRTKLVLRNEGHKELVRQVGAMSKLGRRVCAQGVYRSVLELVRIGPVERRQVWWLREY